MSDDEVRRRVGCKAYPANLGPLEDWCLAAQMNEFDGMCRGCKWQASARPQRINDKKAANG